VPPGRLAESASPDLTWLTSLAPGRYLVQRRPDGTFRVEPYRERSLQVAPVATLEQTLSSTQTATLIARVTNVGTEDLHSVPVAIVARYPNGTQDVLGPDTLDLPRGASDEMRTMWAPSRPGGVSVQAVTGQAALDLVAEARRQRQPLATPTPVPARPPGSREQTNVAVVGSTEGPVVQLQVAPPAAGASSAQLRARLERSVGGLGSGVLLGLIGLLPAVAAFTILAARRSGAAR
jgi:hypothetical protein